MGDHSRLRHHREEAIRLLLRIVPDYCRYLDELGRPHMDPPDVRNMHEAWRKEGLIPAIDIIRTLFVGSRLLVGESDNGSSVKEVVLRQAGNVPVFILESSSGGEDHGVYLSDAVRRPTED